MAEFSEIAANVASVQARMAAACTRAGRDPASVRLLPATKTVPAARLRDAFAAGLSLFGENKVQEAQDKAEDLADLTVKWSIIGHVQTNKAKHVARFASEFQALDSRRLAAALDRRLQIEGRGLDVFIQINTSGEASKFGLDPDAALNLARELPALSALRVRGLMTLAIFSGDEATVRACFQRLRHVQDVLRQDGPPLDYGELSMGMSGDFEIAIEEGATIVRVGQAIFGPRPLPNAYYWPR